jgi:hypothetical protein
VGIFTWFRKKLSLGAPNFTSPVEYNNILEDETLLEFHQRIYSLYSQELKDPAVRMLREAFPEDLKTQIRAEISADPNGWAAKYHFFWGMGVRNLLREKGFGEEYFPIWNLDDIYVSLVEDAVKE